MDTEISSEKYSSYANTFESLHKIDGFSENISDQKWLKEKKKENMTKSIIYRMY